MTINLSNTSILVVEDIPSMRELMVSLLTTLGVTKIFTAADGKKAVEIFYRTAPDIVITDWNMEPVDGLHLTRLIRRDPLSPKRGTPVILVTTYSDNEHISQARDAGVTEYLIKPFSTKDLSTRLDSVINHPRPFIDVPSYVGPCRRRRKMAAYKGPFRRNADWGDKHATGARSSPEHPMQVALEESLPCSCRPPSSKPVDLSSLRILLVEDNLAVCLTLKMMLTNLGITQVFTSYDGKQAIQFLDSAPEMIDLIISDWEMPHVTGIELLRQIRTVHPDMPFVFLTGHSDLQSVRVAKENGVDAFLTKPVSLNDLRDHILKAMEKRRT